MQSWHGVEPPKLDLALGLEAGTGNYVIEDVEVTGGSIRDSTLEACIAASLVGVRFSVPGAEEGTRLRIGETVSLPLAGHSRRGDAEE